MDDINIFASSRNITTLEFLMNSELRKVKAWCDTNKLSINFTKTNFMTTKSPSQKCKEIISKIENEDGSCHVLERKDRIKDLGVCLTKKFYLNIISHTFAQERLVKMES